MTNNMTNNMKEKDGAPQLHCTEKEGSLRSFVASEK